MRVLQSSCASLFIYRRCSGNRSWLPRLRYHAPKASSFRVLPPGTGLQSPETGSQNRRYRDLGRQQRPHVPHLHPRKCPQIAGYLLETGKHRFESDCVVPGRIRTSNQTVTAPTIELRARCVRTQAAPLAPHTMPRHKRQSRPARTADAQEKWGGGVSAQAGL